MEGQYAQNLFESAIIPATSGFLICVTVLVVGIYKPVDRPAPWRPLGPSRRVAIVHTARLLLDGYVGFLVIVLLYSHLLQHEPTALSSALWGVPFLMAIALPAWIALTSLASALAARRGAGGRTTSRPVIDAAPPPNIVDAPG